MSELAALRLRVDELEATVAGLLSTVSALAERLGQLEGEGVASAGAASNAGFELVGNSPQVASAVAASVLGADRIAAAEEIGRWLKKCLADTHPRGLSGRERIPLANKCYLVVRDFDRVIHNPPKFFVTWGDTKALTHKSGQPGDSVFIGLPSKADARVAVVAAGLQLPAALRQ